MARAPPQHPRHAGRHGGSAPGACSGWLPEEDLLVLPPGASYVPARCSPSKSFWIYFLDGVTGTTAQAPSLLVRLLRGYLVTVIVPNMPAALCPSISQTMS